jgi:hypothetical protein
MATTGNGGSVLGGQADAGSGGSATFRVSSSVCEVGGKRQFSLVSVFAIRTRSFHSVNCKISLALAPLPHVPGSITVKLGDGGNVVNGTGSAGSGGAASLGGFSGSSVVVGQSSGGGKYNNGTITVIGGRGGNVDAGTYPRQARESDPLSLSL